MYRTRFVTFSALFYTLLITCLFVTSCGLWPAQSRTTTGGGMCPPSCPTGSGATNISVFVEPAAGTAPILNAIHSAQKSIYVEMYLLTEKHVISALEEAANRGIDVRVLLELHPYGSGAISPSETLAKLQAAGIQAKGSNPAYALTHAKSMLVDNTTAYILTSNFTAAALGTSNYTLNREYGIIDNNLQDVQALATIFQADWDRATPTWTAPIWL